MNIYESLDSSIISLIAKEMGVNVSEIHDINALEKGMTNDSFIFTSKNKRYIIRVPGKGTDMLINRKEEYDVYQVLKDKDITDNIIYMSPNDGYKITEFIETSKACDPYNKEDVDKCMKYLRNFHQLKFEVSHTFDIFAKIEFYESLWKGSPSIFKDYKETKEKIFSLEPLIESLPKEWVLTHIDAIPDNFLMTKDSIRMIDWEYSAMQDPHLDIAMFSISANYDRNHVEQLINSYFTEGCKPNIRLKIYCYIAVAGLLWSNWSEYKRLRGVVFEEYSLRLYNYAKEYFKLINTYIQI